MTVSRFKFSTKNSTTIDYKGIQLKTDVESIFQDDKTWKSLKRSWMSFVGFVKIIFNSYSFT